jgi:peptidoglycan/xylan/chitin deacetylase (PgdA/CDA1 family)
MTQAILLFLVAAVVAVVVVLGLLAFWVEPLSFLHWLERANPHIVYRIQTALPLVALSFDDGPHPLFTPQVLEILERFNAKATFFLIGERALQYPELVAKVRAAGHEIGNHYFRNGSLLLHSDAQFLQLLDATERSVGPLETPKLFRPPGGVAWRRQIALAREQGYLCVLGCAYPHDPARPPVWYIRWLVEKNLAPGTIVILHDGISDATRSIAALPHILDTGCQRKLKFVSIGELRASSGSF